MDSLRDWWEGLSGRLRILYAALGVVFVVALAGWILGLASFIWAGGPGGRSPTPTLEPTLTATATATARPIPTLEATPTQAPPPPRPTGTATPTPMATPTDTPLPTETPLPTDTPIPTPAPPVADFSGSPITGPVPLTVAFTDLSQGTVTSRAWDFGDGRTSTDQNPTHVYRNVGNYTVRLEVVGPGGSNLKVVNSYIRVTVAPTRTPTPTRTRTPAPTSTPTTPTPTP